MSTLTFMDSGGNPVTITYTPAPAPPPPPPTGHIVVVTSTNSVGQSVLASAQVGDDPTAAGIYMPLKDSAGNIHPGLTAMFYADCIDIGCTRCDNAYDYINNQLVVTYDAYAVPIVSTNGKGTFDFWRGCRNQTIRYGTNQPMWNGASIDSTLLPHYAPGFQVPFNDSKYTYGYNALGLATYKGMGSTGDRGDIGYVPVWATPFLTNTTNDAYDVMRRADDNSGVFPCYWSDPTTGGIIDITQYPNATTLSPAQEVFPNNPIVKYLGSYDGITLIPPVSKYQVTGCPYAWDEAHETGYNFVSAMVTGSARDRDHAAFWANNMLICFNPLYRQVSGVFNHYQQRGTAWALRSLFLGAYLSSNTAYFDNQLNLMLGIANALPQNPFGLMDTYYGENPYNGYQACANWEQNYLHFVLDVIWNKIPAWKPYASYLLSLIPLLLTDGNGNALPQYPLSTVYTWLCKNAGTKQFLTPIMAQLQESLLGNGWTQAEVTAITAAGLTVQDVYNQIVAHEPKWPGKYVNGYSDLIQYDGLEGGYPSLMRAGAICAANAGIAGGAECLTIMRNAPTVPDCSHDFRFNIMPR